MSHRHEKDLLWPAIILLVLLAGIWFSAEYGMKWFPMGEAKGIIGYWMLVLCIALVFQTASVIYHILLEFGLVPKGRGAPAPPYKPRPL